MLDKQSALAVQNNHILGYITRSVATRSKEVDSTLLSWDLSWSTGASSKMKMAACWYNTTAGTWRWSGGWSTSPVRAGWENWVCSASGREGSRGILLQPSDTKRAYERARERLLTRAYSGRTRDNDLIRYYAEILYCHANEVLKQVAQRSCGYHITGRVPDCVGWAVEQPGLLEDVPA